MKYFTITPLQVIWAKEKWANALRYLLVDRVAAVRFNHPVQTWAFMNKPIITNAEHVNHSMPKPARFAVREIYAELLFQDACINSERFILLRQSAQIYLIFSHVLLNASWLNQRCIEPKRYPHYVQTKLIFPFPLCLQTIFFLS